VLVYARDTSQPRKQARAEEWVSALWRGRGGRLSVQVLQEFYVTVTRKLSPGMTAAQARLDVRDLMTWRPLEIGPDLIEEAWSWQDGHPLSFWDALIVAAADRQSCDVLLSEDLQDGYRFGTLTVLNPFSHRAGDVAF